MNYLLLCTILCYHEIISFYRSEVIIFVSYIIKIIVKLHIAYIKHHMLLTTICGPKPLYMAPCVVFFDMALTHIYCIYILEFFFIYFLSFHLFKVFYIFLYAKINNHYFLIKLNPEYNSIHSVRVSALSSALLDFKMLLLWLWYNSMQIHLIISD